MPLWTMFPMPTRARGRRDASAPDLGRRELLRAGLGARGGWRWPRWPGRTLREFRIAGHRQSGPRGRSLQTAPGWRGDHSLTP